MISNVQKFMNTNTDTSVSNVFNFSNSSQAYDLFNVSLFNNNTFFSVSDIESNFLFSTSKLLAQDIEALSVAKSDADLMFKVFPEYANIIERFEFHNIEDDGSLTEALSTPDVKLYYPEPFIASPSYIHTDLTYLHILQY